MIARRLERRAYQVTCAVDGAEWVRLAKMVIPGLIPMDMSLPVMQGWEATRTN
jgi:CheY-like chemotaxis protein